YLSSSKSCMLSLHDALPISFNIEAPAVGVLNGAIGGLRIGGRRRAKDRCQRCPRIFDIGIDLPRHKGLMADKGAAEIELPFHLRSEEHTSELQSPCKLVCRL